MAEKKDTIDWRQAASNNSIAQFLSDFLFHPDGGKNMDGFIFETELVCGEPASRIKSLKLGTVTYKKQDDVSTYGTAHDAVENIIKSAQLSSYSFSDTERVSSRLSLSCIRGNEISHFSGVLQLDSERSDSH